MTCTFCNAKNPFVRSIYPKPIYCNQCGTKFDSNTTDTASDTVKIMTNKEAEAFDKRYEGYDPMLLLVGHKKDVQAKIQLTSTLSIDGVIATASELKGNAAVEVALGLLQVDVDRVADYRLVIWQR